MAIGSVDHLPQSPHDWNSETLFEIVDGANVEIPNMGAFAGTVASFLVAHLNMHAWAHQLGFAVCEVLFDLGPGRQQRRPDLAYIDNKRWKPLAPAPMPKGRKPSSLSLPGCLAISIPYYKKNSINQHE